MKSVLLAAFAASLTVLTPISFPGGEGGVGFDDLGFAPKIHRVLVPGGGTGKLMLIDPANHATQVISGFSELSSYAGGHGEGITSADEGRGSIFVTDRSSRRLSIIDEKTMKIVASTELGAGPDYVRYIDWTDEVWVTEPRAQGIEIFALSDSGTPTPFHSGFVQVPGGPEALAVDHAQKRVYTNLWTDQSVVISARARRIVGRWSNGCKGSRGLALDQQRGLLFVGCEEGKVIVLSTAAGRQLGEATSGSGVDIIAYSPMLAHLYLPGGDSATMATIGISSDGKATVMGTISTARDAHCVAADDQNHVYVCDPQKGRILVFKDSMPPSK